MIIDASSTRRFSKPLARRTLRVHKRSRFRVSMRRPCFAKRTGGRSIVLLCNSLPRRDRVPQKTEIPKWHSKSIRAASAPTANASSRSRKFRDIFCEIGMGGNISRSIRCEFTDHVTVFNQTGLLSSLEIICGVLSRDQDASIIDRWRRTRWRVGRCRGPNLGSVVAVPQVGGLRHRYERRAA
jgi:hypothetical protein